MHNFKEHHDDRKQNVLQTIVSWRWGVWFCWYASYKIGGLCGKGKDQHAAASIVYIPVERINDTT